MRAAQAVQARTLLSSTPRLRPSTHILLKKRHLFTIMPRHRQPPSTSLPDFQALLHSSTRILALCGAGLSAASGLPTFRGAGGLWRNHDAASLATRQAFAADPALVWLFYAWRRHVALQAEPSAGHVALARLAGTFIREQREEGEGKGKEGKKEFLCLTQNVDGLSLRAGHPEESIRMLHGNLFDLKCFDREGCGYVERDVLRDPLCDALAPASADFPPDQKTLLLPLLDPASPIPHIDKADLPHCPRCKSSLLRPGVVWFGEALPAGMLDEVDAWVAEGTIDIMLVVGTEASVYPAAGYVDAARRRGARVVVVNPDPGSARGLGEGDFWFGGSAAEWLPRMFEGVVGER